MTTKLDNANNPLPKYKCHKIVQAMKIGKVTLVGPTGLGVSMLRLQELADYPRSVDVESSYMQEKGRVDNLVGGYYVHYDDGYESWSPAEAFEAGYTPAEPPKTAQIWPEREMPWPVRVQGAFTLRPDGHVANDAAELLEAIVTELSLSPTESVLLTGNYNPKPALKVETGQAAE